MLLLGADSRWLYTGLLGLVVIERLVELMITQRNGRRALARGGIEVKERNYPRMVALHTALLAACPAEVWLLDRPFLPALGWPMLALVAATMGLRYWAISSLGERWSTRVIVVPGDKAVRRGPYRWLRHPNYLAVVIEVAALPLIHSAWLTALLFSLGNAGVLRERIRIEEQALREHGAYEREFADVPRFLPRRR